MPVRLLHPALVGIRILRALVNYGAAAENLYALHLPQVECAVEIRAGREVKGFAAFGVEALAVNARLKVVKRRVARGRRRRRRRAGKEKEHLGVIEKVCWSGNGKLRWTGEPEADRLALPDRTNSQPPRLDIDAVIPETRLSSRNRHIHRTGNIKADKVVAGGCMGYVDRLPIHGDGEGVRSQLFRNWNRLHPGGGEECAGKRENGHHQHTKSKQ